VVVNAVTVALSAVLASTAITVGTPAVAGDPAGGRAATARSTQATTTASGLDWGSCSDSELSQAGAQCAMLTVPLDYADPTGRTIQIAVSRIRHTSSAADYQGVILVNPGGPGGSGLDYATLGSSVPNGVGDDFDWIGFDPRGVGASIPALRCESDYFRYDRPDYRPRTAHLVEVWRARSKRYADDCVQKHGHLIQHMRTADVARDMDSIRVALGVRKISYYGFSYGTYLGQVYASRYPTHLRRMVLDSTVNARRVWYPANLDQDRAFNRNAKIWFRWVAKYDGTYHLGSTEQAVENRWYDVLNALARHPAGGKVGPDEWTDSFLYAGYYRDTWLTLAHDFSRYVHGGHWGPISSFYAAFNGPGDDNSFAVYNAVQCTDAPWPKKWSTWRSDNDAMYKKAPFLTWDNVWYNAPCLYWGAPARSPVTIRGGRVASALLIDETLDAATPYSGSLATRKRFPNSSLIAEPGGATHADSLSGDSCVDNRIARYLATGHRPARRSGDGPDYRCKPLPDPRPASATGAATPNLLPLPRF
jgi:pimeloyl-ACP methyl ester carboxylesterase